MAWFTTKKVKKCICGIEPEVKIERTDRNQAFAVMMLILALLLPILTIVTLIDGTFNDEWQDPKTKMVLVAYIVFLTMFLIHVVKCRRLHHSWRCSVRQAFFKVS